MQSTITTADIAAFAGNELAQVRQLADQLLAKALHQSGSVVAFECSQRISRMLDNCNAVYLLRDLARQHGDGDAVEQIQRDIADTSLRLISQAASARLASIAQVAA